MATAIVTATIAAQTIFTTPTNMKAKPSEVNIDNQGSSGAIKVQITDTFTPDASVGDPSPSPVTPIVRFQVTVAQGVTFSADVLSLEDIEFLGQVDVVADADDADCAIIVGYHLD